MRRSRETDRRRAAREILKEALGAAVELNRYRSLRDAVLDLDVVLIRTLAAFSIETARGAHRVVFRFAFYGADLEEPRNVEQYPDIEVELDRALDPREEIQGLEETEIVGGFHAIEVKPGWPGNDTDHPKWIVKTHSATQAERIAWRNDLL